MAAAQSNEPVRRNVQSRQIKVSQFNNKVDLTVIANYDSIEEAFQATNIDKGSIIKVCKNIQNTVS